MLLSLCLRIRERENVPREGSDLEAKAQQTPAELGEFGFCSMCAHIKIQGSFLSTLRIGPTFYSNVYATNDFETYGFEILYNLSFP